MKCIVCNNVIDDDSCFCKWCGNPVEEIPWIEEDGLGFPERIPFLTFWREHGKMSVYKRIDEFGRLYSCILFEGKDGKYTIVNFNAWVGQPHTSKSRLANGICWYFISIMASMSLPAIRPMKKGSACPLQKRP